MLRPCNGIKYSLSRLQNDESYNIKIGSKYIQSLLKKFDHSFVLTIASYNAGPGNVSKWINEYGDPREFKRSEQVIDWIENIPFKETRNYVQRVMENMRIYRYLMGDKKSMSSVNFINDIVKN